MKTRTSVLGLALIVVAGLVILKPTLSDKSEAAWVYQSARPFFAGWSEAGVPLIDDKNV